MRRLSLLLATIVVLSVWFNTAAAERCEDYLGNPIADPVFCDDFDRWCTPPPADPLAACTDLDLVDQVGFGQSWVLQGQCDGDWAAHALSTDNTKNFAEFGYGVVVTTHNGTPPINLVRHTHDLAPEILNNPENTSGYGSINGSGTIESHYALYPNTNPNYVDAMDRVLSPDTLKGQFFVHVGTCGHYSQMLYYTELSLDDDHAPVNFVTTQCDYWVDCTCDALHPGNPACAPGEQATCVGGDLAGMACSADAECSVGPTRQILQASDGQVHAAFAVGLMPLLDGTPCYEGTGAWPQAMWRFVVYDGLTWRQFQAPNFDLPMTPGNIDPDAWDLRPWDGWNYFEFAIGTDYIEVRVRNTRATALNAGSQCITECGSFTCVGSRLDGAACGICSGGTRSGLTCRHNDPEDLVNGCPGGTCVKQSDAYCHDFSDLPPGDPPPPLPQPYLVARVPRQYKGPFNRISAGPSKGLDVIVPTCVNFGTPEQPWKRCRGGENDGLACETDADCPASTTEACLKTFERAWDLGLENVILYDGIYEPAGLGACCLCTPGSGCTCSVLTQEECTGTFHTGLDCTEVLCCPDPFADADADGDVDQADFGRFQACFTAANTTITPWPGLPIGCECFDAHPTIGDDDVDSEDWAAFEACASGAGIAANAACDDAP